MKISVARVAGKGQMIAPVSDSQPRMSSSMPDDIRCADLRSQRVPLLADEARLASPPSIAVAVDSARALPATDMKRLFNLKTTDACNNSAKTLMTNSGRAG